MKALILNGERNNESLLSVAEAVVRKEVSSAGWQADGVLLREKKIAPCMGCFGCWIKTPGICAIDDFGRDLARMAVRCDVIIFLTPITFGSYSSELKKAVDRFACSMLLPFFMKINGEIHHKPRYKPLPDLIGIGMLPERDEESERIFAGIIKRNGLNLHCRVAKSAVFYGSQDALSMTNEVRSLLKSVRERRN